MRRSSLGLATATFALWLTLPSCGDSTSDPGSVGGTAGAAGSAVAGSTTGAGSGSGGSATSGSGPGSGGKTSSGGAESSGGKGGVEASGGSEPEPGDGGEPASSGGAGGLVNCDARDPVCKLLPGPCPPMQVREVVGTCWGDCVKIDQCACGSADECPNNNEFTCWMGTHCGPYVK